MLLEKFFLVIPVIIGVAVGAFLAFYPQEESDSSVLTKSKLIDGGSPILGNPSAPITILEFGDYQCTFCHRFHETTLNTIEKEYVDSNKVKIIFKDFPLNGPDSILAAEATHCANDQGKFWEFHNQVYQNWAGERTGWITRDSLNSFATAVNLNLGKFNDCIDSHNYRDMVDQSYKFGQDIGIDATPSFLIFNDEKIIKIRGNQPLEVFLKTFDEL